MPTKEEMYAIIQSAAPSPRVELMPAEEIDLTKIPKAAIKIAKNQNRIRDLVISKAASGEYPLESGVRKGFEDLGAMQVFGARFRVFISPGSHNLETLMNAQAGHMGYISQGLSTVLADIQDARAFAETYWGELSEAPLEMDAVERESLITASAAAEKVLKLTAEVYSDSEQPVEYFDNMMQTIEAERERINSTSTAVRAKENLIGHKERVEFGSTILSHLDYAEQRILDWQTSIKNSEEKLKLTRDVLPALADGSASLNEFVRLSGEVIQNTLGLVVGELSQSYKSVKTLGKPRDLQLPRGKSYRMIRGG